MTSLSNEVTFEYSGAWPPKAPSTGLNYSLVGPIIKQFPLRIRRAGQRKGYLSMQQTSDVSAKYCALVLQPTTIKNTKTNSTVSFADFVKAINTFLCEATGEKTTPKSSPYLVPDSRCVCIWCPHTIVADAKASSKKNIELRVGVEVKIETDQSSLLMKSIEILKASSTSASSASSSSSSSSSSTSSVKFSAPTSSVSSSSSSSKPKTILEDSSTNRFQQAAARQTASFQAKSQKKVEDDDDEWKDD
eukprot:TRINITY_DN463_c1_g2_i1.p1 TRINITY_DN463_c1_g2~~TRINITY_DN463_c1_g2_i1.p1  ORF type:complete len:247 (+),score=77.16 TRINITY_DN463_c1_g2_i1:87-827(+)